MRMQPGYLPTPHQIAEACLMIRETWSPSEQQRRLVGYAQEELKNPWLPPRIDTSLCHSRVRKEVSELTA